MLVLSLNTLAGQASYNIGYYIVAPIIVVLIGVSLGFIFRKEVAGRKVFNKKALYVALAFAGFMIVSNSFRSWYNSKNQELAEKALFSKIVVRYTGGMMALGRPQLQDDNSLKSFTIGLEETIRRNPSFYGVEQAPANLKFQSSFSLVKVKDNSSDIIRVDSKLNDLSTIVHFSGYRKEAEKLTDKSLSELDVICIARAPVVFKFETSNCEAAVSTAFSTEHFEW
jgi:hypothetical protein